VRRSFLDGVETAVAHLERSAKKISSKPMKKLALLFLFGFSPVLFAGDSTLLSGPAIAPVEAIKEARASSDGFFGIFQMRVQSTDVEGGAVILFSELDRRDPRCLSIALLPSAVKEMFRQNGLEPIVDLKGKTVRVRGTAEVRQALVKEASEKFETYYTSIHIVVLNAKNLVVVQ
jgi:hypothetical protein